MVLFGVLAVIAYRDNAYINQNHDTLVASAQKQSATDQKKLDDDAYHKANEEPFRLYTATSVDGSFQLQIPKNWSIYANHSTSGQAQLDLSSDPDVVDVTTGAVNSHAFKLQLLRRSLADVLSTLDAKVKKKKLASTPVTVSGISGTKYTGAIDDQHSNGILIVIPVRDKTMTLSVENSRYQDEFAKIVASAKVNP